MDAIADMTDRQIYDLCLHECRTGRRDGREKRRRIETEPASSAFQSPDSNATRRAPEAEQGTRWEDQPSFAERYHDSDATCTVGGAPVDGEQVLALFGMMGLIPQSRIAEVRRDRAEYEAQAKAEGEK